MIRFLILSCLIANVSLGYEGYKSSYSSVCKVLFDSKATGSGFFVENSLVLTCAHGVRSNSAQIVYNGKILNGDLIAYDTYKDRALFRLKVDVDVIPLKIRMNSLNNNEVVYALGFAGIFKCIHKDKEIIGRVNKGFSGGPIVDNEGKVVGVLAGMRQDKLLNLFCDQLYHWLEDNRDRPKILNINDYR